MNTFKSTSPRRPSQATLYQRQLEERKDNEARAWGALIWVHRDIAADIDLRYWAIGLDGVARVFKEIGDILDSRDGWQEHAPNEWMLHRPGELVAEVFSHTGDKWTAIVWYPEPETEADCAHIGLLPEAMRWCNERLEHADELERTGAVDASKNDSDLLAEARARDDAGWSH